MKIFDGLKWSKFVQHEVQLPVIMHLSITVLFSQQVSHVFHLFYEHCGNGGNKNSFTST